jgi:hypothetical protein
MQGWSGRFACPGELAIVVSKGQLGSNKNNMVILQVSRWGLAVAVYESTWIGAFVAHGAVRGQARLRCPI